MRVENNQEEGEDRTSAGFQRNFAETHHDRKEKSFTQLAIEPQSLAAGQLKQKLQTLICKNTSKLTVDRTCPSTFCISELKIPIKSCLLPEGRCLAVVFVSTASIQLYVKPVLQEASEVQLVTGKWRRKRESVQFERISLHNVISLRAIRFSLAPAVSPTKTTVKGSEMCALQNHRKKGCILCRVNVAGVIWCVGEMMQE